MTLKPNFDYDYIVVGSGAGGAPAASILASSGKKVAIIERAAFGGESPNWGDIPLGTLNHIASIYRDTKAAAEFGLRTGGAGYNFPSILAWRDHVIKRTGVSGNRAYYEKQGISVFSGNAHFLSPNELSVHRRHLSSRKFLIATGADWVIPNIPGLSETPFYTPQTISEIKRPPKTMLILGANATALELAYFFATFGTKVFIAETSRHILPDFDADISKVVAHDARTHYGMELFTRTKVVAVEQDRLHKRVTFTRGRTEHSVRVDEIVIADKREPATDIGLENAGVHYDQSGIGVSDTMQTSARHIFAAGSVTDTKIQTHDVLTQSRIAAHNMLRRGKITLEPRPNLQIIFTQPQIAQTGLNEYEAIRRDLRVKTATAPLTLTARSNITNQRTGLVKLLSDKKGTILGGAIVAPNASDMINEITLAVQRGLSIEQIVNMPHSFTSWSEAIRIAAGKLL